MWAEFRESALLLGSFTIYGTEGMRAGRRGLLREALASGKGWSQIIMTLKAGIPENLYAEMILSPSELLMLPIGQTHWKTKNKEVYC